MEFWGIEVKPGECVKCDHEENKFLHLSHASLGEANGKENVPLFVKINDQKLVIGTLSVDKCTQISLDLVFEKEFELSHASKSNSVYFCGYKSVLQDELSDTDDYPDTESEPEEVLIGQNVNGKSVVKQDQGKPTAGKASVVKEDKSGSKRDKKAEPAKADTPKATDEDDEDEDEDEDEDDEDYSEEDSGSDEDTQESMGDSDDEDEDESSEKEEEATPKQGAPGKRPAESASKTPAPEKKAKVLTPAGGQKIGGDGKKGVVRVATPHPAKPAGKTSGNSDKSKQQTPKSAGSVKCSSCARTFNSENALKDHTKAKHG